MVELTSAKIEKRPLQNTKMIFERGIGRKDIDVINLKDEQGNEAGKFVRFTVTIPDYLAKSEDFSFMVATPKAEDFAAIYQSGSGKIRVYEYSARDGRRMVARVFSDGADINGVIVLPCLTPNPKS